MKEKKIPESSKAIVREMDGSVYIILPRKSLRDSGIDVGDVLSITGFPGQLIIHKENPL